MKLLRFLGNVIWVLFGGLELALMWALFGVLWCVTIAGIPVGVQCFKMAKFTMWPFGKSIVRDNGVGKFLLNVVWCLFGGLELAVVYVVLGVVFFITIIGIPFARQNFKLAGLALRPFGAKIVRV